MPTVLPGIKFEVAPRPLDVALPRMDVAAFVGLASSGPVGMPVACEDVSRFRQVFGADLVLGRDETTGRTATSHLGPAVEAFFAAGGRRCLVVRVARTGPAGTAAHVAQRARVALPGVVDSEPGADPLGLATLRARAVGGWAQGLWVSVGVDREPLRAGLDVSAASADPRFAGAWALPAATQLAVGDLLEVRLGSWSVFAPVTEVVAPSDPRSGALPGRAGAPTAVLGAGRRRWFRVLVAPHPDATVTRLGDAGAPLEVELVAPDGAVDGDPRSRTFALTGNEVDRLRDGDVLRLASDEGIVLAPIAHRPDGLRAGPLWRATDEPPPAEVAAAHGAKRANVARVTLRLRALAGDEEVARLDRAGLEPEHPLGLPSLPFDEVRFEEPDASGSPFMFVGAPAEAPRPLPAPGLRPPVAGPSLTPLLVTSPRGWTTPAPVRWDEATTGLAREGLLPLNAELFSDDRFTTAGLDVLRRLGDQHRVEGARDLAGVHALLSRRQVTLAAVPDAVHVGWDREDVAAPDALEAPVLELPTRAGRQLTLQWAEVTDAVGYQVEVLHGDALDPCVRLDPLPPSARSMTLDVEHLCEDGRAVRVRAWFAGPTGPRPGPASVTRLVDVLAGDFEVCDEPVVALELAVDEPDEASVWFRWHDPDLRPPTDGAPPLTRTYELAQGSAADLADARGRRFTATADRSPHADLTLDQVGAGTTLITRLPRRDEPTYARVRVSATAGTPAGPWSRVVGVPGRARDRLTYDPDAAARQRREVQRALLHVAAARGDILALLSLPEATRARDAAAEVEHLLSGVAADDAVLLRRHAVVHHPWVVGSDLQPHPPDGAVCGLLADVAIRHGAWVAPANRPLLGTVGVWTSGTDEAEELAASRINPLVLTIPGVVAATARTLAPDDDLDRIGPRRLLMLLLRLAEREGVIRVFAPDGPDLRASLRTTFTRALTDLYVRGALAGASPREGFEVAVHDRPAPTDPPGQVVVELRVAPAQPMEFVTVRLVERSGGATAEVAS